MDRTSALRKWAKLRQITVERGATVHEAATAAKLVAVLQAKYGFAVTDAPTPEPEQQRVWRDDFDVRFRRAEQRAATRWNWEYRQCYKRSCHCMRGGSPHGPYKYAKVRNGQKVSSIYLGR